MNLDLEWKNRDSSLFVPGQYDCPDGFRRLAVAGGAENGARAGGGRGCNFQSYSQNAAIPDNYFLCARTDLSGSIDVDPQDAFGGFESELICSGNCKSSQAY